MTVLM